MCGQLPELKHLEEKKTFTGEKKQLNKKKKTHQHSDVSFHRLLINQSFFIIIMLTICLAFLRF